MDPRGNDDSPRVPPSPHLALEARDTLMQRVWNASSLSLRVSAPLREARSFRLGMTKQRGRIWW
jgi:hypothetical protein